MAWRVLSASDCVLCNSSELETYGSISNTNLQVPTTISRTKCERLGTSEIDPALFARFQAMRFGWDCIVYMISADPVWQDLVEVVRSCR